MHNESTMYLKPSALSWLVVILAYAAIQVDAQSSKNKTEEKSPGIFRVYSQDGRESQTATCKPVRGLQTSLPREIHCQFVTVRLNPPNKPLGDESISVLMLGLRKMLETSNASPAKFREFELEVEKFRKKQCQEAADLRELPRDASNARVSYQNGLKAACKDKDPQALFELMRLRDERTCALWVHHFDLDFKKVGAAQWLFRQETPGLLSGAIKIYELSGKGSVSDWTLTETRVPLKGSTDPLERTVWTPEHEFHSDVPCDFISHNLVQAP